MILCEGGVLQSPTLSRSSCSDKEHNEIADGVYLTTSGCDDRDDSVCNNRCFFFVCLFDVGATKSMDGAPKYVYVVSMAVVISWRSCLYVCFGLLLGAYALWFCFMVGFGLFVCLFVLGVWLDFVS